MVEAGEKVEVGGSGRGGCGSQGEWRWLRWVGKSGLVEVVEVGGESSRVKVVESGGEVEVGRGGRGGW